MQATELSDRQQPMDTDAEICLVGSMLVDPRVIDDVALLVAEGDFYDQANGILFGTMRTMHGASVGIDTTTLVGKLKDAGKYELIGGGGYIGRVIQSVTHAAHAVHYANTVRDKSVSRQLIDLAQDTLRDAYDANLDAATVAAEASDKLLNVGSRAMVSTPTNAGDLLHAALESIELRKSRGGGSGVMSGINDLDDILGGFRAGELAIIGGRPAMGKSALMLNMAEHAALGESAVLVCSLEMSEMEYADRLLASLAKVNSFKIRNGLIDTNDRMAIVDAAGRLAQTRLAVIDDASMTVAKIASHARLMKRRQGLDIIFVDYLQIIAPTDRRLIRQEQVAEIGRDLKRLARTLDVPVVAACQLNKESGNAPPELHHLRESDALSHEADVVMFVYRPEYYFPDKLDVKGLAQVLVRKQRMGPTGTVEAVWRKEYTRFENKAPDRFKAIDDYNDRNDEDGF